MISQVSLSQALLISDIAGRLYPTLTERGNQNWAVAPARIPPVGKIPPSKLALALIGRLSGTVASSSPQIWMGEFASFPS